MTYSNARKYAIPEIDIVYFDENISTSEPTTSSLYTFAANEQNQVIYQFTEANATTTTKIQQFNNVIKFNQ